MEAKITQIKHNEEEVVVEVGFFSGDTILGKRTFYLRAGQSVEDIKPHIVDALEDFKAVEKRTVELKGLEGTKVSLTGVKSHRETVRKQRELAEKAREEEAKKKRAESAKADK